MLVAKGGIDGGAVLEAAVGSNKDVLLAGGGGGSVGWEAAVVRTRDVFLAEGGDGGGAVWEAKSMSSVAKTLFGQQETLLAILLCGQQKIFL